MRRLLIGSAISMILAAKPATAQRLADLAPGTLVRIVSQQGATVDGPLAEVRGDSVFLSSTVQRSARVVPLGSIARYQYADGEESHARAGALIGGALGLALCFAIDQDDDGWVSCNTMSARAGLAFLFAFPGVLIGNGVRTPRWVSPAAP